MSIFGVSSASQTSSPDSLAALLQISQTDNSTTTASDSLLSSGASSSDSAEISKPAQLFSKLQSLATSDPAKFKQVTADFADKLKAEAAKVGGQQGQFLSNLADKFSQASQTGDVSVLKPQAPSGSGAVAAYSSSAADALSSAISGSSKHHHGHHASGGSSSGSSSSSSDSSSSDSSSTDAVATLFQQLDQELSTATN